MQVVKSRAIPKNVIVNRFIQAKMVRFQKDSLNLHKQTFKALKKSVYFSSFERRGVEIASRTAKMPNASAEMENHRVVSHLNFRRKWISRISQSKNHNATQTQLIVSGAWIQCDFPTMETFLHKETTMKDASGPLHRHLLFPKTSCLYF